MNLDDIATVIMILSGRISSCHPIGHNLCILSNVRWLEGTPPQNKRLEPENISIKRRIIDPKHQFVGCSK